MKFHINLYSKTEEIAIEHLLSLQKFYLEIGFQVNSRGIWLHFKGFMKTSLHCKPGE